MVSLWAPPDHYALCPESSGLRENQEGECALYHPIGSHLAAQSQWPLSCQGGPRHAAESHGHLSHRALTSASPHLAGGRALATPARVWYVLQGPHAPGRWPFLMHTQWTALQGIRAVCEHSPRDTGQVTRMNQDRNVATLVCAENLIPPMPQLLMALLQLAHGCIPPQRARPCSPAHFPEGRRKRPSGHAHL